MKILITAFEPFNNDTVNPSEEILKNIDGCKVMLPVSYNRVEEVLDDAICKYNPDFILSLGYAGSRSEISIETCAYNLMKASIKDNDGTFYSGNKIKNSEDILNTIIDVEKLIKDVNGYNLYQSFDPGRFICNEVYYLSLLKLNGRALFIHVPPLDTMKDTGKSLKFQIDAIKDIIKYLQGK